MTAQVQPPFHTPNHVSFPSAPPHINSYWQKREEWVHCHIPQLFSLGEEQRRFCAVNKYTEWSSFGLCWGFGFFWLVVFCFFHSWTGPILLHKTFCQKEPTKQNNQSNRKPSQTLLWFILQVFWHHLHNPRTCAPKSAKTNTLKLKCSSLVLYLVI